MLDAIELKSGIGRDRRTFARGFGGYALVHRYLAVQTRHACPAVRGGEERGREYQALQLDQQETMSGV